MKLLRAIHTFNPAAGGPVEGITQVTPRLAEMGVETTVVSLDAPDAPWLSGNGMQTIGLGPSGLAGYSRRYVPWLMQNLGRFDCAIVHGVWLYNGYGLLRAHRRVGTPYYIFAHGMLDPWFNRAYPLKRFKKTVYWRLFESKVFANARAALFTCEEERRLARGSFLPYRARERVVNYGVGAPQVDPVEARAAFAARFPALADKPFLLFLSRIHEKKGCDILLRSFAELVRGGLGSKELRLAMAGPCHREAYLNELKRLARELLGDEAEWRVQWCGMLRGAEKYGALAACEAFALPSHQENFGIAVVEALACGRPVLISDRVNIWREIEGDGAGIVFSDDDVGCLGGLRSFVNLSSTDRSEMSRRARSCFEKRYDIRRAAESIYTLIQEAADETRRRAPSRDPAAGRSS